MKYTNKYKLPSSIVSAVSKDTYDLKPSDDCISVTSLISPPKYTLLKKRYWDKVEEDISDGIWKIMGSAAHVVLSWVDPAGRIMERRFSTKVGKFTISGKPDNYEIAEGEIQDYKITSVYAYIFSKNDKSEWVKQLNVYAWLLRNAGHEVNKLTIIMLLRDWARSKAIDYDYPDIPIAVVDIPLWSYETQQKYVEERIDVYKKAMKMDDDDIPCCNKKDRWATDDAYAVYRGKNKRATRVFGSREDAEVYIHESGSDEYRIQYRKGDDRKCKDYCPINTYCNYYQDNYGEHGISCVLCGKAVQDKNLTICNACCEEVDKENEA